MPPGLFLFLGRLIYKLFDNKNINYLQNGMLFILK